jgi:hypothetical protein
MFPSHSNPFQGQVNVHRIILRQLTSSTSAMSSRQALENLRHAVLSGKLNNFTSALKIGDDIIYDRTTSRTSGPRNIDLQVMDAPFSTLVIAIVIVLLAFVIAVFAFCWFRKRARCVPSLFLPSETNIDPIEADQDPGIATVTRSFSGRSDAISWAKRVPEAPQSSPPERARPKLNAASNGLPMNTHEIRPLCNPVFADLSPHEFLPHAVSSESQSAHIFQPSYFVPASEYPNNAAWHVAAAAIGPDYEDDGLRRRRSGGLQSISGAAAQGNDIADADAVDEMLHNGRSVFVPRRNGRYFSV